MQVLGRVVTTTIAGGIADINAFKDEPLIYAYGMMWTVIVGGLWQVGACIRQGGWDRRRLLLPGLW